MSNVIETYQASGPAWSTAPTVPDGLRDNYPVLAQVLGGKRSEDGKSWVLSPCTVSLFVDGGVVKFCLSPKEGVKVAFGCVPEPHLGFESIEAQLMQGKFEWKVSRKR